MCVLYQVLAKDVIKKDSDFPQEVMKKITKRITCASHLRPQLVRRLGFEAAREL